VEGSVDLDRRDLGYLFPVLLVLMLALPAAFTRAPEDPGSAAGSSAADRVQEAHGPDAEGDDILTDFLMSPSPLGGLKREHLRGYEVRHLILTLPDPLQSRFGGIFDRHLDAAQRALEHLGYALDRVDLPWVGKGEERAGTNADRGMQPELLFRDAKGTRLVVRDQERTAAHPDPGRPGVLLFRDEDGKRLVVLLVVGETSTAGIHKDQLLKAVDRIDRADYSEDEAIPIVGPTFTGSLASLKIALESRQQRRSQRPRLNSVVVISGSVTGASGTPLGIDNGISFHTTLVPDRVTAQAFCEYLAGSLRARQEQIAILTESDTAYGGGWSGPAGDEPCRGVVRYTFPLHVSDLRSAGSGKGRASGAEALPVAPSSYRTSLSLKEGSTIAETPSMVSGDSVVSAEVSLAALFESLSRDLVRYILVFASDPKDAIFVASQIRDRVPNTLVALFDADLLYFHSDVNLDLRGALTVSTYPLFPLNQIWSPPNEGLSKRIVFPSQSSQGTYNAVLAQLGASPGLLEYGSPIVRQSETRRGSGDQAVLPVWVQVIGTSGFWPLRLFDGSSDLILRPVAPGTDAWKEHFFHGLETRQTATMFIIVVLILGSAMWILCGWLLRLYGLRFKGSRPPLWQARLLADVDNPDLDIQRNGYVLALLLTVVLFAFVTISVNLLPMVSALRLNVPIIGGSSSRVLWIVKSLLLTLLFGGAAASALVYCVRFCRKSTGAMVGLLRQWIVGGALVITLLCFVMAASWLFHTRTEEQLFLYLRAANWLGGASPLLPVLFMTATGVIYLVASSVRLWGCAGLASGRGILVDENGPKELLGLEADLRETFTKEPTHLRLGATTAAAMATLLLILFYGNGGRMSYERTWFMWFFLCAYIGIYVALLLTALRLHLAWQAVRALLEYLSTSPWVPAFSNAVAGEKEPRRRNALATDRMLAALRSSLDAAAAIRVTKEVERDDLNPAYRALEVARKASAMGRWRTEVRMRRRVQCHLARITSRVIAASRGERRNPRDDRSSNCLALGDRLVACRVVELLMEVLPQMRLLLTSAMGGFLLMLLALASYPFAARDRFMLFNWSLILVAVALAVRGLVQMNRNPILSMLTGTEPNKITWNRAFILRIVLYGLVPLLSLLGAQFPASVGSWFPIVNRLIGAQP
jgi:hypothetical protein